jgi:peroxiredoxin
VLTAGDRAPGFVLPGTTGDAVESYALADHVERGPLVLIFYVFDFHPACTEQAFRYACVADDPGDQPDWNEGKTTLEAL